MIAAQCYIIDSDHSVDKKECIRNQPQKSAPVFIGDDVWIAANATILKGSAINTGAVIGAKALVKGEIPEYGIAVGIPARTIKYRK